MSKDEYTSTFYIFGLMKNPDRHKIEIDKDGYVNPDTNSASTVQISPTPNYIIRNDGVVETLFTLKEFLDFLVHFQHS